MIAITGGYGFIGSHLADVMGRRTTIVLGSRADTDLTDLDDARHLVKGCDTVFHLAAKTGGIQYSRAHPASQYFECARINLNVFEACRLEGVGRLVCLGNLLAYPMDAESPLREHQLWTGPIAPTHLGVGLSKLDMIAMGEMYYREFGMDVTVLLAANAYGPRDRFDPETAHVIPATIMKCLSGARELVVWGDGKATRDFLYVEDLARGIAAAGALKGYHVLNLATGREISIRSLVEGIAYATGYTGDLIFDASKGSGDPRRVASTERAMRLMDWEPRVGLEEGLAETIRWYRAQRS